MSLAEMDNQVFERHQEVEGSRDCPTVAWRGRKGRIIGQDYWDRRNWRVRWERNYQNSTVRARYLRPANMHREW